MTPAGLDPGQRAHALPRGSARYWSWLFASPAERDALLGIFALTAEWRAQSAPAAEPAVARIKLAWWREEIGRLMRGEPLHPLTRHLAALPGASTAAFAPLAAALEAVDAEIGGVPLETGTALEPHAAALCGDPLALASRLADAQPLEAPDLRACTSPLAAGWYLADAAQSYRRAARLGRVPFPVDELLAAGIESADLCAEAPPARLARYLEALRERAAAHYRRAAAHVPRGRGGRFRHLAVLTALGLDRLERARRTPDAPWRRSMHDMLVAWKAARGARR